MSKLTPTPSVPVSPLTPPSPPSAPKPTHTAMTQPAAPSPPPSSPAPKRRSSSSPPALLRRARTWSLCLLYALECCPHQRQWQIDTFLSINSRLQYAVDRRPGGEGWRPVPLDILPTAEAREAFERGFASAVAQARTFRALDTADLQTRTSRMMNVMLSFDLLRQLAALPQGSRRSVSQETCLEALKKLHPGLDFAENNYDAFREMIRFMDALKLASDNVQQVWPLLPQIDATIQRSSKKWRVERMASIDRNILRLATFELRHRPDVPPRVALNEAIELAKTFGAQAARGFVNGILQQICNDNAIQLNV